VPPAKHEGHQFASGVMRARMVFNYLALSAWK
jgi:hypothetical protein